MREFALPAPGPGGFSAWSSLEHAEAAPQDRATDFLRMPEDKRSHMKLAARVDNLPPYLFFTITKKIREQQAKGQDVISLSVGDPDLPPPQHVIDRLVEVARSPVGHLYPESDGIPALRQAFADWYERRFGVGFVADGPGTEVIPLIGSKEGIGHIALCLLNPGDVALITDPGYVSYSSGTAFAGATPYYVPLTEENGFLPDLEAIPDAVADKATAFWLNYPNNPCAVTAELDYFERVVHWAKQHEVLILHDAPYTEITFDGYVAHSFLEVPGARDVAIEINSLSKTFSMQGYRVGVALGNQQVIDALTRVKSHMDSGIPPVIQEAAIAALNGPQESIAANNVIYQRRRDRIMQTLENIGIKAEKPKASLYIWCHNPAGMSSMDYSSRLIEEAGVVVTPGSGFGENGEGFFRISLTVADDRLEIAMQRLEEWSAKLGAAVPAKKSAST